MGGMEAQSVEYGKMAEILVQRAGSSEEFTRLTALTWIHEFVKLGGAQLVPYYAAILGALLPCISDGEEKIRAVRLVHPPFSSLPLCSPRLMLPSPVAVQVARETNEEQMARVGPNSAAEGFEIAAVLTIARR